jgi:hypothetical protein
VNPKLNYENQDGKCEKPSAEYVMTYEEAYQLVKNTYSDSMGSLLAIGKLVKKFIMPKA